MQALAEFDRKQWLRWSRSLPRRMARFRPGSLVFRHLALERWTEAHKLHRQALRSGSPTAFHRLRIGIKRFRYIVENFLPEQHAAWSDDLKHMQDMLGEVHDLDVLWPAAVRANVFPDDSARSRWQDKIQRGARPENRDLPQDDGGQGRTDQMVRQRLALAGLAQPASRPQANRIRRPASPAALGLVARSRLQAFPARRPAHAPAL